MTAVATTKAERRRNEWRARSLGAPFFLVSMTVTSAAVATPTEGAATAPSRETPSSEEHFREAKGPDVLFLETETGIAYVGLQTLHVKRDVVPTSTRDEDFGGFFGLMGGMKLLFLSVGPHARFGRFRDWDTWSLDLDVGFHAPVGPLEPFLRLGGGYTRLSRAFDKVPSGGSIHSDGYDISLTFGADYFLTHYLAIGGRFGGELIGLRRAGVNLDKQDGLVNDYLKYDGAALGFALNGALALGLHL
jgi:hypothetical protein